MGQEEVVGDIFFFLEWFLMQENSVKRCVVSVSVWVLPLNDREGWNSARYESTGILSPHPAKVLTYLVQVTVRLRMLGEMDNQFNSWPNSFVSL